MVIWFITNVDTEVLALRAAIEALPPGFRPGPGGAALGPRCPRSLSLDGVVACWFGCFGAAAWPEGFDELRAGCVRRGIPLLAFGGEAGPDAEMTRLSTVASATVTEAFAYLVNGGPGNFEHLLRFVADTVLLEGYGFDPPRQIPSFGMWRAPRARDHDRPLIGVVFYRAHLVAGNTRFVDDLCDGVEAAGGDALAIWCYSLRDQAAESVIELLARQPGRCPGHDGPGDRRGGGRRRDRRQRRADSTATPGTPRPGLARVSRSFRARRPGGPGPIGRRRTPVSAPTTPPPGIAVPEFDGRIIAPVSAFNEVVDDGDELGLAVRAYRTVPDRVAPGCRSGGSPRRAAAHPPPGAAGRGGS